MLLGKRPRPPMKRTTSMKDVALDLGKAPAASPPSDPNIPAAGDGNQRPWNLTAASGLPSMVSPLGLRRSSGDYTAAVQTAPFLRVCDLCKGLLRPGRDIFMYRGEIAFCSLECREQQIKLDERNEKAKCSVASRKDSTQAQAQAQAQANPSASEASDSAETVAAA